MRAEVQLRVDACPAGFFITSVNEDGSVVCDTFNGATFALSDQACPAGERVTEIDDNGQIVCVPDVDTTYSGADFAISGQNCGAGQLVKGVDATGAVVCVDDVDTNTLYTAGPGLQLMNGQFSVLPQGITRGMILDGAVDATKVDTASVQSRLQFGCPEGDFLVGIEENGLPICSFYDGIDFALSNQDVIR